MWHRFNASRAPEARKFNTKPANIFFSSYGKNISADEIINNEWISLRKKKCQYLTQNYRWNLNFYPEFKKNFILVYHAIKV